MQVFRSYDRESQGVLTVAQIRHILGTYGKCFDSVNCKINNYFLPKRQILSNCALDYDFFHSIFRYDTEPNRMICVKVNRINRVQT